METNNNSVNMSGFDAVQQEAASVGLLNDFQYNLAMNALNGVLLPLSFAGVVANVINVKTFVTMGVYDSITVCFLALACTDFLSSLTAFGHSLSIPLSQVSALSTQLYYLVPVHFMGIVGIMASTGSMLTILYIAIARCMCVIRPIQFRTIFTKSLSVGVVTTINIFSLAMYLPILANTGVAVKFDPKKNETKIVLWVSPYREAIKDVVHLIIRTILPQVAQVILTISVIVMAVSLLKSTRFRQASTPTPYTKPGLHPRESKPNSSSKDNVRLSGKELQAVQQVFLICTVFILCNIPSILIGYGGMLVPGFDLGKPNRYYRLYFLINYLQRGLDQVNTSVNILFYYRYNSKFRNCLRQFWTCSGHGNSTME